MDIAKDARFASTKLKILSADERSNALLAVRDALAANKDAILEANKLDLDAARQADLPSSLIKRLDLTSPGKYDAMLQGIADVAALDDPVGKVSLRTTLDDGLELQRVSCPIGVILVIFEARPEVIANITALALKSGNAAILKGGKESLNSFTAIADAVTSALAATKIPASAIQLVATRADVASLLDQTDYIDLVIPRGSNKLVSDIKNSTRIPVLGHADGICSAFVNADADPEMAAKIVVDAKTNYPAGCNAIEQLLVHKDAVKTVLPTIASSLADAGVVIKATPELFEALKDIVPENLLKHSEEGDFDCEFLNFTIATTTVGSVEAAIEHINAHSSKHTDVIITASESDAQRFLNGIDSASVFWNASSRFADGFRFGFGAEVGISTSKIHSRGPVGLEGLVIYQYQLKGSGQVAGSYIGAGGSKAFKHIQH
ncbi:hypothetical protein CANCADRAFT_30095 [Tortispora caseinolytica NRRL Y-17796]|uniref:glutamate-5-semialdehyde dehydrogenase n=1 Tax=Tortispora caseinolytica NRRL Y-17796 TaxID=767744 RepID=A0A1E4TJ54_9ASCO|nr:hypothetical protein CANCADRAFT_30095 [Tortispora caseinolytica NRRL Y-17796]